MTTIQPSSMEIPGTDDVTVLEVGLGEIHKYANAIGEMYSRQYVALVVKDVFPESLVNEVRRKLESGEVTLPRAAAPTFKGGLYGHPLVTSDEDLTSYLDEAKRFRERCQELFADVGGLEATVERVLGQLSGGIPVVVPQHRGRAYVPATIRVLVDGDSLPIHYENGTTKYPSMNHLLEEVDSSDILSYYVPFCLPDAGGELHVYTADCTGTGVSLIQRLGGPEKAALALEQRGHTVIRPGLGDMLVFDGGRHYHQVTTVVGQKPRWTLGGFLAYTKNHDKIYYWS